MKVLLDQECAAVAGGHESACERNVTIAAIATGALIGGAAGGALGAVGGAGTGSLIAQVVAPPLCRWAADQESESEDSDVEVGSASGNPFRAPSVVTPRVGGNVDMNLGAPLQYVVDSAGSNS